VEVREVSQTTLINGRGGKNRKKKMGGGCRRRKQRIDKARAWMGGQLCRKLFVQKGWGRAGDRGTDKHEEREGKRQSNGGEGNLTEQKSRRCKEVPNSHQDRKGSERGKEPGPISVGKKPILHKKKGKGASGGLKGKNPEVKGAPEKEERGEGTGNLGKRNLNWEGMAKKSEQKKRRQHTRGVPRMNQKRRKNKMRSQGA